VHDHEVRPQSSHLKRNNNSKEAFKMELGLAGKSAIVTGGGSNIGRGIALGLAREKADLVIAEIDPEQGQKVADQAKALGAQATVISCDVTDWDSVQATVQQTIELYGKVDILVNNVGWTRDLFFAQKPREDWVREININFWSVINTCRAVIDHMVERKYGKVINIGSDAGRMGEPREAVYSGTKGGVIALTKALAREYGRYGINFNSLCPGVVVPAKPEDIGKESLWHEGLSFLTPERQKEWAKLYPLGRLGQPEDIANAVVFLASDAAAYITGQTLSVDGGFTMI
jgi:NAD(P)-dependent dehydrogenase (short-subunit alcohol dehydrogenase family)